MLCSALSPDSRKKWPWREAGRVQRDKDGDLESSLHSLLPGWVGALPEPGRRCRVGRGFFGPLGSQSPARAGEHTSSQKRKPKTTATAFPDF